MSRYNMFNNKFLKLATFAILLVVLTTACQQQAAETEPMEEPTQAEPTIELVEPEEPIEAPTIAAPTQAPTSILPTSIIEEPAATSTKEPKKVSGKECVQGYWAVDPASMQTYALMTMLSADKEDFTPSAFSGDTSILITYDKVYGVLEDAQLDLSAGDSTISVVVKGTVSANYSVNDSRFKLHGVVYDLEGMLVEPIRTSTLDLNGLFNLVQFFGFGTKFDKIPISAKVDYTCVGDTLTLDMNENAYLELIRTQE